MTHRENKAFGRATANRIWALMFGRPLVDPIDDVPEDDVPAVLDILADDFISHGYDLRRMIRAIADSEAFACDSRADSSTADERGEDAQISDDAAASWARFPITRLRPEQVIGGVLQSASLETIDYESHILTRIIRAAGQNEFIQRYGDDGDDEFSPQGGTIPQRLLMMNGKHVTEVTSQNIIRSAATRIALLASTDSLAIETAYLAVLTRRPTPTEADYFAARMADKQDERSRGQRLEDLYWTLLNSTEFSWNH